jgi:hypothetical protein
MAFEARDSMIGENGSHVLILSKANPNPQDADETLAAEVRARDRRPESRLFSKPLRSITA